LIPSALLTMGDEVLGRGGFGEVLSGSLNEGEAVRPVALKRLNLSRADAQMFGSALLDEVGIMMSLDHCCVLRCFGTVLDPAARDAADRTLGCCIVTELCPLKSLRGALDQLCFGEERGPKERAGEAATRLASWATSLKVACDVARGMAYLYSKTPPVVSRAFRRLSYLVHK
jgi:serine/threonine protein kinase